MSAFTGYNYEHQLKAYLVQFAAVFGGMQVSVGKRDDTEPHLITVPIKNASQDRVVGAIKGDNTQNKMIRLPLMTFQFQNIELAPELRKGIGTVRRQTTMPTAGLFPDDLEVVSQIMPVPYRANFELKIWASNQDQHYQIMEQILTLFDPIIQLQKNDDHFDWARLYTVELTNIQFDETIPMGVDRRLIQSTLTFSAAIHLSMPAMIRQNVINDIFLRIGAVGTDVETAADIISDLDGQGIEYEQVFDSDDVQIDK